MLRAVRRIVQRTVDALTRPVRILVVRTAVRFFPTAGADGFDVVDWAGAGPAFPQLVSVIAGALRLIEEQEPRRYGRLRKDVKRFLITPVNGAEYIHAIRACMLSPKYLLEGTTEQVATTIVHEGTHARLNARGIRYSIPLRERIERALVCEKRLRLPATYPAVRIWRKQRRLSSIDRGGPKKRSLNVGYANLNSLVGRGGTVSSTRSCGILANTSVAPGRAPRFARVFSYR